MNMRKCAQIAFFVVGVLTVAEFLWVRGMFTWIAAIAASTLVGLMNVVLAALDRDWMNSLLYALCTVALCMGYVVVGNLF